MKPNLLKPNLQSAIRRLRSFSCRFYLFLLPALFVQSTPFTIVGRVAQPDDRPAARAIVKIRGQAGFEREVYTDDMGRFEIQEMPGGSYSLTAVNPSAPQQSCDPVEVDLNRSGSRTVSVNIFLRNRATGSSAKDRRPAVVTVAEETQEVPRSARKAFEEAMKLRGKRQYDRSLEKFGRSIELFPSYFQALAERGHLLLSLEKVSEAMQDFRRALELNARYGPALRGLGLGEFHQGRYAEAIQELARAVEAEPGNATNYYFMGIAGVALDRREQARAALERALNIDPVGSVRAHVHLASLLIKERRPHEAAKEIEVYLEAVPNPFDGDKLRALLSQLRAQPKP